MKGSKLEKQIGERKKEGVNEEIKGEPAKTKGRLKGKMENKYSINFLKYIMYEDDVNKIVK